MKLSPSILSASIGFFRTTGLLDGPDVVEDNRRLEDLSGVFEDESARQCMDPTLEVYSTRSVFPVADGKSGGLFFGCTTIHPGRVGDEFFMTKGHFHANVDTGEFYWGIRGEGILLMMGEDRRVRAEQIQPGSLHYIPGCTAHRVVNSGDTVLTFGACWPSDAGHDYGRIRREGFAVRVKHGRTGPVLVEV